MHASASDAAITKPNLSLHVILVNGNQQRMPLACHGDCLGVTEQRRGYALGTESGLTRMPWQLTTFLSTVKNAWPTTYRGLEALRP